ncbi:hypothetical protein KDX27_09820 [Burkholderia cenocepacia]|uniref:hypothetical protein n=1 Tax=Burkholderia cenocepacia TaxID=95486 RepID=UPI001B96DFCE|nr:hypothetical protein [Burkholderia cenocepacia]MBR8168007.1 hypothetical protein [Burkholderia cenocepacia]
MPIIHTQTQRGSAMRESSNSSGIRPDTSARVQNGRQPARSMMPTPRIDVRGWRTEDFSSACHFGRAVAE